MFSGGNNISKKVQLDKDKTVIFAVVSIAAIAAVAVIMIGKGLWAEASYLGRVADKKETAVKRLEENKEAVTSLVEAYNTFNEQNPNALGGSTTGASDRDGTNSTLVLDALPSKYDFPALVSSVEKILSGFSINKIEGVDDSLNQLGSEESGPVEMPFVADVTSDYAGFKQIIGAFNKSIRPFHIVKLDISGNNSKLQTKIEAKTFYQPERGLEIKESTVK